MFTRIALLSALAVTTAIPSAADAQHRGHGYDRPVHVVHQPDPRLEASLRGLEHELHDLRRDVRAFDDPTAAALLHDARAHLSEAETALRRGRDRGAIYSLDAAEDALRATSRRIALLDAELDALRREARSEIAAAERLTARGAPHEAVRLLIAAQSAGIDGDGAMIRREYLDARASYGRAIEAAERAQRLAYAPPRDRGRVQTGHGWHDDRRDHRDQGGYLPARYDDDDCDGRGRRDRGPW